ncbi:MAG: metal-dependent transcriptional regulator [Thermoplasmata archaeon]|nr:metal-dependent transcriptional regulator [Thermoplasmata archaeon]
MEKNIYVFNINIVRIENMFHIMKEIYREYEEGKMVVGPTDIATRTGMAKSTAYHALKELARNGYGRYIEKKGFILNSKGLKMAKKAMRRHRLLECFIVEMLELSPEKACMEASKIDGVVGEEFMMEIEKKYGGYKKCPCGKKIP